MNIMGIEQFVAVHPWITWVVILWSLPWKGVALWKAVKRNDQWWFIGLLLVNTLALVDIAYIYYFSKRPSQVS